jgi:hypothetical protein
MTFLDQLPPARTMPSNRHDAARRQLRDMVEHSARSWWHLGRSATIALVIGLMVTGSAAAGVLSSPTPTTIPSPSASAALVPPPGSQPLSGVTLHQGQPLVPMGAPTVALAATKACNSSDLVATLGGAGPYNLDLATSQQIVDLSATSPCFVSGYAELRFSSESGTTVETNEVDRGYKGAPLEVSNVSLGSTNEGSFLYQYVGTQNGPTSNCQLESSLSIEIPDQSLTVNVNVDGVAFQVCGTVNVSPIIQGDSVDRYVP